MKYETVILRKETGIATILLNRPEKRNALSSKMFQELIAAITDVANDSSIRVVVIAGMGKAFCAGGDLDLEQNPFLSLGDPNKIRARCRELHQLILMMRNLEKPIIASVNGAAVGAGCDLALACDIRVAADTASFGEVYARVGAVPDTGGTYLLPRLVGLGKACELILTGDVIDATEAYRIGLVNKVVPLNELEGATRELARKLANGAAVATGLAKTLIHNSWNLDLATALEQVASAIALCFQTKDLKEAISAFEEKRVPVFKGE